MFQRTGQAQKVVEHMYSILRPRVEIARIASNLYSSWGELGHMTALYSQGGRSGMESWLYAQLKSITVEEAWNPFWWTAINLCPQSPL